MIEKLEKPKSIRWGDDVDSCIQRHKIIVDAISKINELVDAVNNIVSVQEKLIDSRFVVETKHEEPTDPYAEQRKWLGKLCKFWDYDGEADKVIGVLTGVFDEADRPFERNLDQRLYKHCELVKPDDDVIYKGE